MAMLVTTSTTAAAFFGNSVSRIRPIRYFGVFMGLLVIGTYLMVLTVYAAGAAS